MGKTPPRASGLPPPAGPRPGEVMAHYRLIDQIGEGGMGVVWRALDTRLEREVALKFLPQDFGADPERLARLEREARIVASLNHPNIVTVHSVEEASGRRFLTMELLRGRALASLIPVGGLPLGRILELALPLSDAIAAAHDRGIVHRDLKPRNIMLTEEGRLKVLDFGLAAPAAVKPMAEITNLPTASLAGAEGISGTLPYMSPEQVRGSPTDARSDLFSIGIILHEMATGRRPFGGPTPADVIAAILKDVPPPITRDRPELPAALDRLIQRCLEKDPGHRLPSAVALRGELERIGRETAAGPTRPSIAVLPFADLSREKDQAYFCEGIAEEILSTLARVEGLQVASRTSSFRFKDAALESREIGRRLGVETLLEGSVRKAGNRVRITVEMSDVAGGFQLWSERFDRELKDIFAIQDEIARRVVEALQVTLTSQEQSALGKAPTSDVQAYDYYLRGRKHFYLYSRRGIEQALEMFSRAIDRDRSFALAYGGLADCFSFLYWFAGRHEASRTQAEAASRRAVELDPHSAEAHASRGQALSLGGRHDEAQVSFQTALQLNPRLFEALYFFARDCFVQGKLEEAVRYYEQAAAVRPEDHQAPLLVAQIYEDLGRREEARAARLRGIRVAEEHLKIHPEDARALYMGANGLVALGEISRGLEWADRALAMEPDDAMLLYNVACIRSMAGQREAALDCLEKAVRTGLTQKEWLMRDNNLDQVRDHPRFQTLLARMDRPEETGYA